MVTKDELRNFIANIDDGGSSEIANKLLLKYDITEKPLAVLYPGDIFRRHDGYDTIVWSGIDYCGVYPQKVNFYKCEKWILVYRIHGLDVNINNYDNLIITINKNGNRIG